MSPGLVLIGIGSLVFMGIGFYFFRRDQWMVHDKQDEREFHKFFFFGPLLPDSFIGQILTVAVFLAAILYGGYTLIKFL